MKLRRVGLLTMALAYGAALPGVALGAPRDNDVVALRRHEDMDVFVSVDDADDDVDGTDDVTNAAETRFAATWTSNADGDATRGDDGTWGARTVTSNGDGDATRGDDGTSGGDGGTITSNADGDGTRGDDGTNGAATVTANDDADDTRGDDGTSDGDNTRGEDGTSDGDDTATTTDDEDED